MSERLGREAQELIERALREEVAVDAAELARIRTKVVATSVGIGAAGAAGKALALHGGQAMAGAGAVLKAALFGAGAAAIAIGVSLSSSPRSNEPQERAPVMPAPSAEASAASKPAQPARAAPPAEHAPSATQSGIARMRRAAAAPRRAESLPVPGAPAAEPASSTSAETKNPGEPLFVRELALLEQVQAELRAGNGAQALRLMDESPKELENGQLRAERLAAEVFAACQAGQLERAQRARRRFLDEYPNTPTSARVRASCEPAAPQR